MNKVTELTTQITDKDGKWHFKRNFDKKILPYFTRNPERATFEQGFKEIVGVMARRAVGKNVDISEEQKIIDQDELLQDVSLEGVSENEFLTLFSRQALNQLKLPQLIVYTPLANSNQRTGQIRIGEFLNLLFQLDQNQAWQGILSKKLTSNPYEKLIDQHMTPLADLKMTKDEFAFLNVAELRAVFQHDLKNLCANTEFFMANFELFFAFYYFTYSVSVVAELTLSQGNNKKFTPYYALEYEHVSQSRLAASTYSYSQLYKASVNLLVENDLLDYLNYINDDTEYHFMYELKHQSPDGLAKLQANLKLLITNIRQFVNLHNEDTTSLELMNLDELIATLHDLLKNNVSAETSSRFRLSLDEIGKAYFVKSHGRLGKVFNLSDELIIMLVGVILGSQKMLLNNFLNELNLRGIFLDRSTRDALVDELTKKNLLEKLSDSGDAQYVKPLL